MDKEYLNKMKASSHLLPDPGGEVVRGLIEQVENLKSLESENERLEAENAKLRGLVSEYDNLRGTLFAGDELARQTDELFATNERLRQEKAVVVEENTILRRLLWLNHGHQGLYGDDGEMQCGQCLIEYGFWDYKRTAAAEIEKRIGGATLTKGGE